MSPPKWVVMNTDLPAEAEAQVFIYTCRHCLGTGTMLERLGRGMRFISGCVRCGRRP